MVGCRSAFVVVLALLVPGSAHADFHLPDPDVTPPVVAIVMPIDGVQLVAPTTVDVTIEASDPQGPRGGPISGISTVWLEIDGVAVTPMRAETYAYSFEIDAGGSYELRAHAVDFEGNFAMSQIVRVNASGPPGTGGTTTNGSSSGAPGESSATGEDSSGMHGEDTGEDTPPSDDSTTARGCACTLDRDPPHFAWALLGLALRRRRAKVVSSRAR